ncbi:MAG: MMPL family transporter, partial [Rhodospirillaceae bacterium]|nr:MMPL family transporter [Rhodospirillaceae bacterium]
MRSQAVRLPRRNESRRLSLSSRLSECVALPGRPENDRVKATGGCYNRFLHICRHTDMNLDSCIALIMGRRWLTVLLSLLLMLVLATGAMFIVNVDVDVRNHFSKNDPHIVALEQLEDTYALSDAAFVTVAPRNGTVFTREALVAIEDLTEQLWHTPYVTRIDSIANYSHSEGREDELIVERLIDGAGSLSAGDIRRIEKIALETEEVAGRLVSRDGQVAGLVVSIALPENRQPARVEIVDFLNETLAAARAKHADIDYHLTGEIVLNRAMRDAINDDMGILAPLALVTMLLVAIVLLRSIWGTVAIIVMLIVVFLSALGFIGWAGMKFYGESGAALFVLMAVTVAHSV